MKPLFQKFFMILILSYRPDFSSSLFQFILATDEISDGMFHDTVRRVWGDAGPQGLRSTLAAN